MTISTLKDLYIDQLQDIYSADKQSLDATKNRARTDCYWSVEQAIATVPRPSCWSKPRPWYYYYHCPLSGFCWMMI